MIAAYDNTKKAVWGLGHTECEARVDAAKQMKKKRAKPIKLSFSPLKDNAPTHLDGETLYDFLVINGEQHPQQIGLI